MVSRPLSLMIQRDQGLGALSLEPLNVTRKRQALGDRRVYAALVARSVAGLRARQARKRRQVRARPV